MARFVPEGSYQKTSQNIYVNLYCEAQKEAKAKAQAKEGIVGLQ